MTVTVLVPTWRRTVDLARCIEGLAAQTHPPNEVLVVVRHDDRETWSAVGAIKEQVNDLVLAPLSVDVPGVAASLNAGFDAATGDVVAITDDDSVPRPDWVARIVEAFASDDTVGAVGGRDWVHQDGGVLDGEEDLVGRVLWFGRNVGNHHLGAGGPRQVDVLKGVNMAFRRRALGGIRIERALRGAGTQPSWEVGLCLAVQRSGWKLLYDPAIAVDHFPAPRPDDEKRSGLSGLELADHVYNEAYGLLVGLSGWRKGSAFAYGVVVGTRHAPGLLIGLERRVHGVQAWARTGVATKARFAALLAYIRRAGQSRPW